MNTYLNVIQYLTTEFLLNGIGWWNLSPRQQGT